MAMRYDARTGVMIHDADGKELELGQRVPGWHVPRHSRYGYELRIGDAERDETMSALREHFAAGRLTLDELTERIDGALGAKTQRQLNELMTDLPRSRPTAGRTPAEPANPQDSDAAQQEAGRYIVTLLLLFALALVLLMMAWVSSHSYWPGAYPVNH